MNRYFLAQDSWSEGILTLGGDEAHHAARVMRKKTGDSIEIFDGGGRAAICEIKQVSKAQLTAQIRDTRSQEPPSSPITLCQSIPKGGNMELVIQKAVELGVNAIQPLVTEHTVARPEAAQKKCAKWQRIALEACKQCGQNFLPRVSEPLSFADWIGGLPNHSLKIVAALRSESRSFRHVLSRQELDQPIQLLVGPEGDFSSQEYELAFHHGFQPVSLGNIVLRVETASIYCLSVLKYQLSED